MAQKVSTQVEFTHGPYGATRHSCGAVADTVSGDLEIVYCSGCFVLDHQAVQALQTALTDFKASGKTISWSPTFNEFFKAEDKDDDAIRQWFFSCDIEVEDEELERDEYEASVILLANGTYEVRK